MSSPNERRTSPRVPVELSVKLRSDDGRTITSETIRNISLGGVFVEMAEPLAFGTEIHVEFTIPVAPRVIRCKGFVVWTTKTSPEKAPVGMKGVGLRLLDIAIADMRALHQYISEKLST